MCLEILSVLVSGLSLCLIEGANYMQWNVVGDEGSGLI